VPLFAAGISHHEVAADTLAGLARHTGEIVERLLGGGGVRGVVPLATCNRFELYLDVEGFHSAVDHTMAAVLAAVDDPAAADAFVVYAGQGVVEHLFEVACGLDSMVVGEVEIVGQVRTALAQAEGSVTPPLRRLFQHALTTSKAVVTEAGLGAAGRSLASVGLDLAGIDDFAAARVVVVGTGSYARVVVADLVRRGAARIGVYSRSGQAERFAGSHPVRAIAGDGLADALREADLVVCCSGTGGPVLTPDMLQAVSRGPDRRLPVIDLSGGADVDPGCESLPMLDVVTLDRIGALVPLEQSIAVLRAQETVGRAVATYLHVEEGRTASPAVTAMRSHVQAIIDREIEQATARHSPETAEAIARSLRRVSNSLLHAPSVRAADLARTGDLDDYRRALKTLFGIVVDAQ